MFWDEKKNITTIMSKRKPDGEKISAAPMKVEVVKDEDGKVDGRHEAAQDILAAIHEKSADKLNQALQNHYDLHASLKSDEQE